MAGWPSGTAWFCVLGGASPARALTAAVVPRRAFSVPSPCRGYFEHGGDDGRAEAAVAPGLRRPRAGDDPSPRGCAPRRRRRGVRHRLLFGVTARRPRSKLTGHNSWRATLNNNNKRPRSRRGFEFVTSHCRRARRRRSKAAAPTAAHLCGVGPAVVLSLSVRLLYPQPFVFIQATRYTRPRPTQALFGNRISAPVSLSLSRV